MIIFDWTKVYQTSGGSSSNIINIIAYLTLKPLPLNNYDHKIKRLSQIDWSGNSYLLNPMPVITARRDIGVHELAQYVALASFRNLAEYKTTKRATLRTIESPVDLELLKNNELLTIVDDQIFFCWEETKY